MSTGDNEVTPTDPVTSPLELAGRCGCGKLTSIRCHELWAPNGMRPCNNWLCSPACPGHHHEPGTMGYANIERVSAEYLGDEPDGPGLWELLKSAWRTVFWSDQRKAQFVWDRFRLQVPSPAPLPPAFRLTIRGDVYAAHGDAMLKVNKEK